MAWPSPPRTFSCPACGWKHTMASPMSDCRVPGFNDFRDCPRCGSKVESRHATVLEVAAAKARSVFGQRG